jgi:hypothetical protein
MDDITAQLEEGVPCDESIQTEPLYMVGRISTIHLPNILSGSVCAHYMPLGSVEL